MKRIAFVDDESEILDGLRGRLYKRRRDWEMVFLTSGAEAITELESRPVDLLVTDIRMPGMDGGQLLSIVKERWPGTIRLVLSGFAEQVQLLKLVSLAHQYISKPCDTSELENIIDRCFHLHDILDKPPLRTVVGSVGSLPTIPRVYTQLQAAMMDPDVGAADIAKIISTDVAITAKVLQVVNSAFFRMPKHVTQLKYAVEYLGVSSIRNLVLSAEVFTNWQQSMVPVSMDLEQLQTDALATAAACQSLAKGTKMADDAWLTGLVHDIGYWVLMKKHPAKLDQAIALAHAESLPLHQAEQQIFGTNHAEVGAYLLGLWGMPYPLVEAVALHHTPLLAGKHEFGLLSILAIARSLMKGHDLQSLPRSDNMEPEAAANYFATLINPPFDWQEASSRLQSSGIQAAS